MKVSLKESFSYGLGAFGKNLVYGLVSTFLLIYYTDVLVIDPAYIGILIAVARVWDAFNGPIMGAIIDGTKTKMGRFRPWILVGTIINAIVVIALFLKPNFSTTGLYIYVSITYVLFGMSYTLLDLPFWSMIPTLSNEPKQREKVAIFLRTLGGSGTFVIALSGLLLVELLGGDNEQKGFFYLAIISSILFVICMLIMIKFVKEKNTVYYKEKIKIRQMFQHLFKNDQLLVVITSIVLFNSGIFLTTSLGIYFFKYDFKDLKVYSIFIIIAGASQLVAMLGFPIVSKYLSRKSIFVASVGLPVIGYTIMNLIGVIFPKSVWMIVVCGVPLFLGVGLSIVLGTVILADTVEYGEWKLGRRSESMTFSMNTFMMKIGGAITGLILGVGLDLFGFAQNETQAMSTLYGIRFLMIGLPIVGLLLSLTIFLKFYKISNEFYEQMVEELHTRREKEQVKP